MGFEREPSVIWAENLKSLDELSLSKRTKNFLNEKYGTLDEIVLVGRKAAHNEDGKYPKAVKELADALKTAGYIRKDLDSSAFAVNDFYVSVFGMDIIDTKVYPCYVYQIVSNELYESYKFTSKYERARIFSSLDYLNEHTRAILGYYYGLANKGAHSLDETAEHFNHSREHVIEVRDQALRRIRAHKDDLPSLLPATEEQKDEVENIIDELERLYSEPIFARACQLRSKLQRIAKLPFTCAGNAKYYLTDGILDETPIDEIGLTIRVYSRLKRAGINTVAQIMRNMRRDWRGVSTISQSDREEIATAIKNLGYKID